VEYPGPHLLPACDAWPQIADDLLAWAVTHAINQSAPAGDEATGESG
jgi:hypothetical protein